MRRLLMDSFALCKIQTVARSRRPTAAVETGSDPPPLRLLRHSGCTQSSHTKTTIEKMWAILLIIKDRAIFF